MPVGSSSFVTVSVLEVRSLSSAKGFASAGTEGSVVGTLSRERILSYDGDLFSIVRNPSLIPTSSDNISGAVYYGFRVLLDSKDVTTSVVGEISVLRDLDRLASAEVLFYGKEFSFLVTEKTWTRTLLEVYFTQGLAGKQQEVLEFRGYVFKGSQKDYLVFQVLALNIGHVSSQASVCLDLAPDQGLTRDQIIRDVFLTAGFQGVSLPPTKGYNKPYNFTSEVWRQALEFLEPEGLHLSVDNSGVVRGYQIRVKDTPDHIWDVSELINSPDIVPPSPTESVWIFRGEQSGQVTEGSDGVIIERRSVPLFGIYNPQTTHTQDTSGNIVPRSFLPGAPYGSFTKLRLIKLVESEVHRIGNVVIRTIDREFAFKNPSSARYITAAGQSGLGPQGTNFVSCYVLDNEYLLWPAAKFIKTLERIKTPIYDEEGTDVGSVIESYEFFRRTKGVRTPAGSHIVGILVGGDDMSYDRNGGGLYQIEDFGLASRFDTSRSYSSERGFQELEEQITYGWYSVRGEVDNNYLLFDGSAQVDFVATFQKIESVVSPLVVDQSGREVGRVKAKNEYYVRESSIGQYDWGNFTAEADQEVFRTVEIEADSYDAISSSVFEKVVYKNGRRESTISPGRPPVPRYKASSYTKYVTSPIEFIINDNLIENWFGRKTSVDDIPHALSLQELIDIGIRRRSRELSFQVKVTRHETLVEEGDTVLLSDFNQGLFHSGIVISIKKTRGYASSISEYHIEIPLLDTGLLF